MKKWTFPAGERGIQITEQVYNNQWYTVHCDFKGSDSIIDMLLEVDAVRRIAPRALLNLNIEYFPYARQDRVMQQGESHSLRVICDLINSQKFDSVETVDPHSDVVAALVNNLTIKEQHEAVIDTISPDLLDGYDYFVAPDAGALKKIYKLSKHLQKPVICASKQRDVTTGNVTASYVSKQDYDNMIGKKLLVVDDICDGGRTFTELRDILPTTATVDLYITHGIFSKGKKVLTDKFNQVFCYNDMSETNERIQNV